MVGGLADGGFPAGGFGGGPICGGGACPKLVNARPGVLWGAHGGAVLNASQGPGGGGGATSPACAGGTLAGCDFAGGECTVVVAAVLKTSKLVSGWEAECRGVVRWVAPGPAEPDGPTEPTPDLRRVSPTCSP